MGQPHPDPVVHGPCSWAAFPSLDGVKHPDFFFFAFSQWEAFSLPELQNFLRILDKEEDEQLQNLKKRYAAYRQKLEEALSEVWKPD